MVTQATGLLPIQSLRLGPDWTTKHCGSVLLFWCLAHQCRCGATVQSDGLHPLSCRFSAGRFPRHSTINNIIRISLGTAGLHSILEPGATIVVTAEDQMESFRHFPSRVARHWPGMPLVLTRSQPATNTPPVDHWCRA